MICRKCNSPNTYVVNSREKGSLRRRRYRCDACGERFTTLESYEKDALFVNGSWVNKEAFEKAVERATESATELVSIIKKLGYRRENDWKD